MPAKQVGKLVITPGKKSGNRNCLLFLSFIFLQYMKPLRATIGTSQPVMSAQDFDTLFFRVPELHELHSNFYKELKPRLDDWNADTAVGVMFKRLVSLCDVIMPPVSRNKLCIRILQTWDALFFFIFFYT